MITREQLVNAFAVNLRIVQRQTEGLSHEDSLLQPPFRGNCLNWVLGHVAVNRDRVLRALGEEPVLTEEQAARYESGSAPVIAADADVLALEQLLDVLSRAQDRIADGLGRLSADDLNVEIAVGEQTMTLGRRLFGLYFHETYHVGQTELLRQLAGTDDRVI